MPERGGAKRFFVFYRNLRVRHHGGLHITTVDHSFRGLIQWTSVSPVGRLVSPLTPRVLNDTIKGNLLSEVTTSFPTRVCESEVPPVCLRRLGPHLETPSRPFSHLQDRGTRPLRPCPRLCRRVSVDHRVLLRHIHLNPQVHP